MIVDLVRGALFATAHFVGGSLGGGILAVSLLARIALMPWTLPAARRMRAYREAVAKLPKGKPQPVPPGMLGSLAQLPIGAAMYQAIGRTASGGFLWIRDLARPDVGLAIVAAAVTALATTATATDKQAVSVAIGATITFAIMWHISSGVALYSIAWSGVSAAESWLARRK
jgi:membrane protein insertase Oxa1/YidC/SpoIIIJ